MLVLVAHRNTDPVQIIQPKATQHIYPAEAVSANVNTLRWAHTPATMSHACGHAAAGRSAPRTANAGPVAQAQQSRNAAMAYSRAARSLSAGWCGRTQCLCLRRASARVAHGRRGGQAVRALRNIDQPEALLFDCDGAAPAPWHAPGWRDPHRASAWRMSETGGWQLQACW